MPSASIEVLVHSILDQLPESNHEAVIAVKQEGMANTLSNGQDASQSALKYDPTVSFLLEFATTAAIRDDETVEVVGKEVFDATQSILRHPTQWHAITVSRAALYALTILKTGYVSYRRCNPPQNGLMLIFVRIMTLRTCPIYYTALRRCHQVY